MSGDYVQILKASEILEKAFLVSQQHVLGACAMNESIYLHL